MGFGGEGEQAAAVKHARHHADQRGEIGAIGQHVGGDDKVGAAVAFGAQEFEQVGNMGMVVAAGAARLLDHGGGEIDADQRVDARREPAPASPVPQPRSSARPNRGSRPSAPQAARTASNRSCGPR